MTIFCYTFKQNFRGICYRLLSMTRDKMQIIDTFSLQPLKVVPVLFLHHGSCQMMLTITSMHRKQCLMKEILRKSFVPSNQTVNIQIFSLQKRKSTVLLQPCQGPLLKKYTKLKKILRLLIENSVVAVQKMTKLLLMKLNGYNLTDARCGYISIAHNHN